MRNLINPTVPIIPQYIKEYIANYYSNTSSKFIYNNQDIEIKNYYLTVEPTPEQIANITNNFQNKSPYPEEIFLPQYMLNVNEELDKTTGEIITNYFFVLLLIGKIYPMEGIFYPNILSNDYLTSTYYRIEGIKINPDNYVGNPLPIKLTNEQTIKSNPEDIEFSENNVIFPNSTRYVKVRTGKIIIPDAFPFNTHQPSGIVFIKDENTNLISSGGIGLFNINFLTQCSNIIGTSLSIDYMIKSLQ